MSKDFEDEIDIDSIVIEDVDIRDIENRKQQLGKEDDIFVEGDKQEAAAVPASEVSSVSDHHTGGSLPAADQKHDEDKDDDEVYEVHERPKRSKGDIVRYCVMFVALCVLVYSVFSLVDIFLEYKRGEDEYGGLEEKYTAATADPNGADAVAEYIDQEEPLNPDFQPVNVDWPGLKAENGDVCAWIQFETLSQISYPVVHGSDNDYYLHHTVQRTENSAGSIFIEAQNSTDFSDMNTIIYGHNMKNGSMFGLLRYYKEQSYYAGNEYFWIYTPQANYRYKIFSCYEPMAESETYTWWSDPCDEYTNYLTKVQSYSKYSTGVTLNPADKIVTLSTCTSRGSDYRFVVHGKLVYSSVNQTGQ